jgi:hypothetical protein
MRKSRKFQYVPLGAFVGVTASLFQSALQLLSEADYSGLARYSQAS